MAAKLLLPLAGICMVDVASSPDADSTYLSGGQVVYATIKENLISWNEATLRIQVQNVDQISPLLTALNLGEKPLVYFRFGITSGDSSYWRPWEKYWLVNLTVEPTPNGIASVVVFKLADLLFELSQECKTVSRKGLASDIFKVVCREHNFDPSVEVTDGKYTLLQTFMTDFEFIMTRLIPRSINSSQMGGYFMYQKNSKLFFTTIDYSSTESNIWSIPYNTTDNFVDNLILSDSTRLLYVTGGAGVRVIANSPVGLTTPNSMSSPDNALKLSTVQGKVSDQTIKNIGRHILSQTSEDALAIPQDIYAKNRLNFYRMAFTVPQTSLIQVRDYIELDILDSSWSGLYVVNEMNHEIDNGHLTTAVSAIRGETNFKKANAAYVSEGKTGQQLANSMEARGKAPRIISTSTEGATVVPLYDEDGNLLD